MNKQIKQYIINNIYINEAKFRPLNSIFRIACEFNIPYYSMFGLKLEEPFILWDECRKNTMIFLDFRNKQASIEDDFGITSLILTLKKLNIHDRNIFFEYIFKSTIGDYSQSIRKKINNLYGREDLGICKTFIHENLENKSIQISKTEIDAFFNHLNDFLFLFQDKTDPYFSLPDRAKDIDISEIDKRIITDALVGYGHPKDYLGGLPEGKRNIIAYEEMSCFHNRLLQNEKIIFSTLLQYLKRENDFTDYVLSNPYDKDKKEIKKMLNAL